MSKQEFIVPIVARSFKQRQHTNDTKKQSTRKKLIRGDRLEYADYEYYTQIYHGSKISEQSWAEVSKEASAYIDLLTYQRLKQGWQVTESVKNAVCAVSEVLYSYSKSNAQCEIGIASESVSGRSINYVNATEYATHKQGQMQDAAGLYLPTSDPLRYAGV